MRLGTAAAPALARLAAVRALRALVGLAAPAALLAAGLVGCASIGGGPSADGETPPAPRAPAESPLGIPARGSHAQETGVEIVSVPEAARVYVDERYVGLTPLFLDDLARGTYKLTLKKDGYYATADWIDYAGGYLLYTTALKMVAGFLQLQVQPPTAEVRLGPEVLSPGRLHELPVGSHTVRVRAFGYDEQARTVQILEREVTTLEVSLAPAALTLSDLRVNRAAFDPRGAGLLGQVQVRFRVSAAGTGSLHAFDPTGREVHAEALPPFSTWEQQARWDGRDQAGRVLPDGEYRLRITAASPDGTEQARGEVTVRIDASLRLRYRSLWSGSAGALYCPVPEVLPARGLQLSTLVLGGGGGAELSVPADLAVRVGLGARGRHELDALAGSVVGQEAAGGGLPFFAAAAFKTRLLDSSWGPLQGRTAAQAKLAYQNFRGDVLADYSGLSLGLPASLGLGAVTLAACPEIVLSPRRVWYEATQPPVDFYAWLYGRLGLLVDLGSFSFALSGSFRSLPFQEGWGLDEPFQAALEGHWLVPRSQLFLSLALAAELLGPSGPQLRGGGGLGLLR